MTPPGDRPAGTLPVFTAVTDAAWEAELVAALAGGDLGVTVVRRCVDVAELLGAAATGTARAVVLSAGLRRLDGGALDRLAAHRMAVVGLVEAGEEAEERRLRQLGVVEILAAAAGPARVAEALRRAVERCGSDGAGAAEGRLAAGTPAQRPRPAVPGDAPAGGERSSDPGRVVAVWGPTGAPGRTTLAIGLADECARLGLPTLLVDADPYGGACAQLLGLLDESAGLATACRAQTAGRLDVPALAGLALAVTGRLRVLTGISRADRWLELRPAAVESVLALSRRLVGMVVVDCGFCLEQDEELAYDTLAPRRNGSTLAALAAADEVIAVGSADPIGVHRLVRGLAELAEAVPGRTPLVAVNRLRRGPVPGDPAAEVAGVLQRHAGVSDVAFLPYDRVAADAAVAAGRTIAEAAPDAPLRRALAELAGRLAGTAVPRRRRAR